MNNLNLPDELVFADEAPQDCAQCAERWKLLIVDDDEFVHRVTELTLGEMSFSGRRVEYLHAYSAAEARIVLAAHPDTAVILLDVVMETENAGLDFARHVRQDAGNSFVRIILRTGQPGQAPERTVITEYDINDYKHKAELSEQRLFTAVTAALRSYCDLRDIERGRLGMREVLDVCSRLFACVGTDELLALAVEALLRVAGAETTGQAVAATHVGDGINVLARYGRSVDDRTSAQELAALTQVLETGKRLRVLEREFAAVFTSRGGEGAVVLYAYFEHDLGTAERELLRILGENVGVALHNVQRCEELAAVQRDMMLTLGEVMETRSTESANHVQRVAEYSYLLARKAGLTEERAQLLRMASPMHDVGKIGVPEDILFKEDSLTEQELAVIRSHSAMGHAILRHSPRRVMRAAASIALQHHERWDGDGYPGGLAEDATHIFGRITALADAFDALTVDRVYRKAWPLEQALAYLQDQRGQQFDPVLVDLFLDNLEEILAIRERYPD